MIGVKVVTGVQDEEDVSSDDTYTHAQPLYWGPFRSRHPGETDNR